MNRSDILYGGKIVMCHTIIAKSGRIHRKVIPYVGQFGMVHGGGKNGQLLVQFGTNKNLVTIPHSCLTSIGPFRYR